MLGRHGAVAQRCCSGQRRAACRPAAPPPPPPPPCSRSTSVGRRAHTTRVRAQQQQQQTATAAAVDSVDALTDRYNEQMAKQMGWSNPYEYHFDRGLYMHEVAPGLFCGTQPRSPAEVEELVTGHGIDVILNLQQDKDITYWGIDFPANEAKCRQLGVTLLRRPAQDFDPHSLRNMLPCAVKALQAELAQGKRVYVHCTAGLGRAPAVCIAWLYWFGPHLGLDEAYQALTAIRPCGPNRDAIRGATYDVLDDRPFDAFFGLPDATWAHMNEGDKSRLQQRLAARG